MSLIGKFGIVGIPERQLDLLDNNTEYLVLGSILAVREFTMTWTFEMPIANKAMTGRHRILVDQAGIGLDYDYSYLDELDGVEFGVDILGTNARLKIITSGLGENPKMVYRLETLSKAS